MKHAGAILTLLSANPAGLGSSAIKAHIGTSLSVARAQLHQLMLAGIVQSSGRGPGAVWLICEELE